MILLQEYKDYSTLVIPVVQFTSCIKKKKHMIIPVNVKVALNKIQNPLLV